MAQPAREVAFVGYDDLNGYLDRLDQAGLLKRVSGSVDLEHELGALCARSLDREGPALMFENVTGYPGKPLVTNVISTVAMLGIAFGVGPDEDAIHERVVAGMERRLPSVVVETGPCKEEIHLGEDVDLYEFPTPVWHEQDGGPYLGTTGGCITRDSRTGFQNMGTYRAMIKDRRTLTLTVMPHGEPPFGPGAADHILANEAEGRSTPIAIALGMDPLLTLASGTLVPRDESGAAEPEVAGAWRGRPTELVRCQTSDLLVPARAQIIVEGEISPGARTPEGPHGEANGFYGQNATAFRIDVRCITHRRNAISYGLICRLIEDYPRSFLRSGSFQRLLVQRTGLTSVKRLYLPEVGRRGMAIVAASVTEPGEAKRIMQEAWKHCQFRWVIVVDDDCDVRNWNDVMWRVCQAADPDEDDVVKGPSVGKRSNREESPDVDFVPPRGGMGIDATLRGKGRKFPPVNTVSRELMAHAARRSRELGLG